MINKNHTLFLKKRFNHKLTSNNLNMGDLKRYVFLVFSDYRTASISCGLSRTRFKGIMNGISLPSSPNIIKKIANGLNIDVVVLTQLFEKERKNFPQKYCPHCKNYISDENINNNFCDKCKTSVFQNEGGLI